MQDRHQGAHGSLCFDASQPANKAIYNRSVELLYGGDMYARNRTAPDYLQAA